MPDLEKRYFERIYDAQMKMNDALDAARTAHDLEVMEAREELNREATARFDVFFGRAPAVDMKARSQEEPSIDN